MTIVDVMCPHRLSQRDALERTKELAERITGSLLALRWTCSDDVIDFSAHGLLRGRASVTDRVVRVTIQLPLALRWMRRRLSARLTDALDVYLYPLESSPLRT
jgi:hypothetical protein